MIAMPYEVTARVPCSRLREHTVELTTSGDHDGATLVRSFSDRMNGIDKINERRATIKTTPDFCEIRALSLTMPWSDANYEAGNPCTLQQRRGDHTGAMRHAKRGHAVRKFNLEYFVTLLRPEGATTC